MSISNKSMPQIELMVLFSADPPRIKPEHLGSLSFAFLTSDPSPSPAMATIRKPPESLHFFLSPVTPPLAPTTLLSRWATVLASHLASHTPPPAPPGLFYSPHFGESF